MQTYDAPTQTPEETAGEPTPAKRGRSDRAATALLVIVSVLLVLTVALQYSFKQDLPETRRLHAFLTKAVSAPSVAEESPSEDPFIAYEGGDVAFSVDLDAAYYAYLSDTLLPSCGLASESDVSVAAQSGYQFSDGARPAHCTGVVSAAVADTNFDTVPELVVLLIRDVPEHYPLELHVYAVENGAVTEPASGAGTAITELFGNVAACTDSSVEIVSDADNAQTYVLMHTYSGEQSAPSDRYIAFNITGGAVTRTLDGACTYYNGAAALVCGAFPTWLTAQQPASSDVTDGGSGLTGKLLYSDGISDFQLNGKTFSYEPYQQLYADAPEATAAMLGPLVSAERIKLLDPLSLDWTGFRFALPEEAE